MALTAVLLSRGWAVVGELCPVLSPDLCCLHVTFKQLQTLFQLQPKQAKFFKKQPLGFPSEQPPKL